MRIAITVPLKIFGFTLAVALLIFLLRHDLSAMTRLVLGQARVLRKTGVALIEVDGKAYSGQLYSDTCRTLYLDGDSRTNSSCYLIHLHTDTGAFTFRAGDEWIGVSSYSRRAFEQVFGWGIVSEIGEDTFDIRDQENGGSHGVVIADHGRTRSYSCQGIPIFGWRSLRFSVPVQQVWNPLPVGARGQALE